MPSNDSWFIFAADSKRLKLEAQNEEMLALANAGQMTNHKYVELTYLVAEQEEEEDQRDFSRFSKSTKAVFNHASFACIGSSSCLKQKNIRKLFPTTLKQCEELQASNGALKVPG